MRLRFHGRILGALALLTLLAPAALAVPLHYTVAGGTETGNFNDPGLVIHTANDPGLAGTSFTLNDGGSSTFNFFNIWTDETTINPDDTISMDISATLNFSDPISGGTIHGVTVGGSILFGLAVRSPGTDRPSSHWEIGSSASASRTKFLISAFSG